MRDRIIQRAIRREPVVDRDRAGIGDDVPCDTPLDPHGVQTLAVGEPVNDRRARLVVRQAIEDLPRAMNRIHAHPWASAVRPLSLCTHLDPQSALAPRLDTRVGRLHQDRQIRGEQLGVLVRQHLQPVEAGIDLLTLVIDVGDVTHRIGESGRQVQRHSNSALHVAGAEAEQQTVHQSVREIPMLGHGVEVATDEDSLGSPQLSARHDRVAVAHHSEPRDREKCRLHHVRQSSLVSGLTRHIDQCTGEGHRFDGEVKGIRRGHVATVAA